MKERPVVLTDEAIDDIDAATLFYRHQLDSLGDCFFDAILADIESLRYFAGVHEIREGYFCMPAKRFPFSVYYDIEHVRVLVVAVLDMRQDPQYSVALLRERR
ncbi:type II toxin-antitoxin system RelE/ParE family toxin [Halomonadaceae bacterium KBTZ08]